MKGKIRRAIMNKDNALFYDHCSMKTFLPNEFSSHFNQKTAGNVKTIVSFTIQQFICSFKFPNRMDDGNFQKILQILKSNDTVKRFKDNQDGLKNFLTSHTESVIGFWFKLQWKNLEIS